MKYSYSLLAAAAAVLASPVPQAVTSAIAPSGSVPAGCSSTYSGSFAIVAITQAPHAGKRQVITQISDGQIQAPTSAAAIATASPHSSSAAAAGVTPSGAAAVGATSSGAAAVGATSSRQSSSAAAVAPPAYSTPVAGSGTAPVSRASSAAAGTAPAGSKPSGAAGAAGPSPPASAAAAGATTTMVAVSQIHDGQIQAPRLTSAVPATPASGSPAAPTSSRGAVPVPSGASSPASSAAAVPAPGSPKSSSSAATAPASPPKSSSSAAGTSPRTTVSVYPTAARPTGTAISHLTDGQPQAPTSTAAAPTASSIAACSTNSTLTLTLADGVLKDARGWTGYIASNYQFQFDNPPQSGAIYTAGFSVCGGNLALGGSTTWYECLSGDFYNLYSENIAPQCTPITLNVAQLTSC